MYFIHIYNIPKLTIVTTDHLSDENESALMQLTRGLFDRYQITSWKVPRDVVTHHNASATTLVDDLTYDPDDHLPWEFMQRYVQTVVQLTSENTAKRILTMQVIN